MKEPLFTVVPHGKFKCAVMHRTALKAHYNEIEGIKSDSAKNHFDISISYYFGRFRCTSQTPVEDQTSLSSL